LNNTCRVGGSDGDAPAALGATYCSICTPTINLNFDNNILFYNQTGPIYGIYDGGVNSSSYIATCNFLSVKNNNFFALPTAFQVPTNATNYTVISAMRAAKRTNASQLFFNHQLFNHQQWRSVYGGRRQ
jgi:hypothetical protein